MAKNPPHFNQKDSSGNYKDAKSKTITKKEASFSNSDDDLYSSRYPKRQHHQPKFFSRNESGPVYEEGLNTNECSSDFDGFGNGDEYHIKRFQKPSVYHPKFFIRDESFVYEDESDKNTVRKKEYKTNYNQIKQFNDGLHENLRYKKDGGVSIKFDHSSYDLFNSQKNRTSSDGTSSESVDGEELENDLFEGRTSSCDEDSFDDVDADDEGCDSESDDDKGTDNEGADTKEITDNEGTNGEEAVCEGSRLNTSQVLNEDDFLLIDTSENEAGGHAVDEPPFFEEEISIEESRPLFAEVMKRRNRVFRKIMKLNPLRTGAEEEEIKNMWKGTPLDRDLGIKMPPGPIDEDWYPKPDDPEYKEPIPVEPGTSWKPWYEQVPSFFPEDDDSIETAGSLKSDYITECSGNFSTETFINSDELSSCPENGPDYPYIPEEAYQGPVKIDVPNEFQKMPEDNPEVRVWFDCKGREFLDVKNDKGEWDTVEQIIPEYPPKPKGPDRWDREFILKEFANMKKEPGCTCNEVDLSGWYDEHTKYKTPPRDGDNKSAVNNNMSTNSSNTNNNVELESATDVIKDAV